MKKRIIFLFSLVLVSASTLEAQKITLSGNAYSRSDGKPLGSAGVVVRSGDEKVAASGITDDKGYFEFKGLQGLKDYSLEISFLGLRTVRLEYKNVSSDIHTGRIFLEEESQALEGVDLVGKAPLAILKGDTLLYNSSAYKTNPDATAEDLAGKMPGIEISGSSIKAQGEDVKKVTVDGKPFFDQDASLTLKTLPASVVEKIEIFDEQSEQSRFTGFDDGNTSKTMNIVTYPRMRNGSFGRFYGGYGPEDYYQAGGNYNLFKGKRRISILGMSNNINIQNFTSEDFLGTSSGGGSRGGRSQGGNNFSMGNQPGLSTTNSVGINYSDSWGSSMTATGSYFFNNKKTTNQEKLLQNYFTTDSFTKMYEDSTFSSSENNNHRLNMRLEYKIDSSNTILFIPRLSFQGNNSFSGNASQNLLDGDLLNISGTDMNSERSGYNYSNELLYSHAFAKEGRTLSLSLNGGASRQNGDAWQNSLTEFYGPGGYSDSIDNYIGSLTRSKSLSSRLSWTEPLGERSSVIINVGNSLRWNSSDKQTYNLNGITNQYDYRDTLLSSVFESTYNSSSAGLGYRLGTEKLTWISTLDYEYSTLTADRLFPMEVNVDHSYVSLLPGSMLRYDFSKTTKLRIFYRTNTSSPTVSQLQDVPDYSNPIMITVGNAALKPSWQQNIFLRFNRNSPTSGSTMFFLVGGGTTSNYVANTTFLAVSDTVLNGNIILSRGSRLIRPVNLDGYRNIRTFMNYGIPISRIKTNLNFNLSWNYSRVPGMLNEKEGFANNYMTGLGVVLSSNINEKVDFTIWANSGFNHTISSLEKNQSNDYFSQKSGFKTNLIFWKGIVFTTDITHQYYSGLTSQYNENYLLWNMGIAKKVFKNQSGEVKFSVYDILKQNSSVTRTVTESYIQDSQNQVLGQYFLFSFTYRLRNFKGGEQDNDWRHGPGMMHPGGDGPPPGMRPGGMRPPGED